MSVVLITGASGAIGSSCARIFAENGYNVIAQYYKNKENALDLYTELNEKRKYSCEILYADVSNEEDAAALFKKAYDIFPSLDALVCAAGVSAYGLIDEASEEVWDAVMNVNAKGTFLCCREALKYMSRRQKGRIVTISSVWGMTGAANEAVYSASKGAVIAFTKALAKEAAPYNINANCIAPGAVYSEMLNAINTVELEHWAKDEIPLKRIGTPEDIAKTAYFLGGDGADYITGQVISPNGGLVI